MRRIFLVSGMACLLAIFGWGAFRELPELFHEPVKEFHRYPPHLYETVLQMPVDSICVIKRRREMLVFHGDSLLKIYHVALGDTPVGHKHFEGDERTPEGLYRINDRNPFSSCHKNLGISYPNAQDRSYAARSGKSPGGSIKIHGLPNGQGHIGKEHLLSDWTNGCVAVTDEEIDELYQYVKLGSAILIVR